MTDKLGAGKAKLFADAHEKPHEKKHSAECAMDYHNNALGREIALQYAGQGYDVFAEKIFEAIMEGKAIVLIPD